MKVYLLHQDRDFDAGASLPPGHEDLIQDLELTTLLRAMAAGDKFLLETSVKVLLASLHDPEAIGYRQRLHQLPAGEVGMTEVTDLALRHQVACGN